jgi:hypothetical protein
MDITLASIKLANVARYMAMAAAHDLPGHSPNWAFGQAVKELGEECDGGIGRGMRYVVLKIRMYE